MKCDICKKDKKCSTWDYIVKGSGVRKVGKTTYGVDTVFYENGKEVGRNKDMTYSKDIGSFVKGRGCASICLKCRIIYSAILTLIISLLLTFILMLFGMIISKGRVDINFLVTFFEAMLFFVIIFACTPLMKHLILALHISKEKNIRPFYKIMSKFWE